MADIPVVSGTVLAQYTIDTLIAGLRTTCAQSAPRTAAPPKSKKWDFSRLTLDSEWRNGMFAMAGPVKLTM